VRIDIFLADAAQVDANGKVHLLGGGWSLQNANSAMAVVALFEVPWSETNERHDLMLELVDGDGRRVSLPGPAGPQEFVIEAQLEVGRPAGIPPGTPVTGTPLAINVAALPLAPGRYEWRLSIDGTSEENWRRSFTRLAPPVQPHSA